MKTEEEIRNMLDFMKENPHCKNKKHLFGKKRQQAIITILEWVLEEDVNDD